MPCFYRLFIDSSFAFILYIDARFRGFYLTILAFILKTVRYKLTIASYKVQFRGQKDYFLTTVFTFVIIILELGYVS